MITDTDRVNWMEANPEAIRISSVFKSNQGRKVWFQSPDGNCHDTWREAVDAGLREFPLPTPKPSVSELVDGC